MGDVHVAEFDVGRLDRQPSAVGHGVTRVHGQVDDHFLDLSGIGADAAARRQIHRQRDVFTNQPGKEALRTSQHRIQIENLRLENLPSAEREQLANEVRGAPGRATNLVEIALRTMGGPEVLSDQLGVPVDTTSRLLKSCAMPPASWPIACIFCDCR
jgi:hypothetical protein